MTFTALGLMHKDTNSESLTPPTQSQINKGWSKNARSVHKSFASHRRLLHFLLKLDVITTYREYHILQKDFEQKTWANIRDGE